MEDNVMSNTPSVSRVAPGEDAYTARSSIGVDPFVAAADAELLVTSALGMKVLNAIDFPLLIEVSPTAAASSSAEPSLGEADVVDIQPGADRPGEAVVGIPEIDEAFEAVIVRAVNDFRDGTLDPRGLDADERAALEVLAARSAAEANLRVALRTGGQDTEAALRQLIAAPRLEFDVLWVKFEVESRPTLRLATPIELGAMTTRIQAKFEACIRVFGRRICVRPTTPRIRIDNRRALLDLAGAGPVVTATPRFEDVDLVIKISILGFSFTIRIGVTGLVNAQLRKQGPIELLNLSTFEQPVPYSTKRLKIDAFDFVTDPRGLLTAVSTVVR